MVSHYLREKKHVKFEKYWRKCFWIQPAYGDFFKKLYMSMNKNIDQQINLSDKIVLLD